MEKLNRIFPSKKKAIIAIIGNKSLKKTIISIDLTAIIIIAIKAVTETAKNLKKRIYLSVTAIAINIANRAISQKNTNRKAISTLIPNRL